MYTVRLDWAQPDSVTGNMKSMIAYATCENLPEVGKYFSVNIHSGNTTWLAEAGKVLELREDMGIITFRTTEFVFTLEIVADLTKANNEEESEKVVNLRDYRIKKLKSSNKSEDRLKGSIENLKKISEELAEMEAKLKGLNRTFKED